MKKMNNKGFSLVELIIVIAIMAVLVGVLAPQFLKYVEKSREGKDEQSMGEVNNAVKVAVTDEKIYGEVSGGANFSWGTADVSDWATTSGKTLLGSELNITVPNVAKFASKKYSTGATTTIAVLSNGSITVKTTNGTFTAN